MDGEIGDLLVQVDRKIIELQDNYNEALIASNRALYAEGEAIKARDAAIQRERIVAERINKAIEERHDAIIERDDAVEARIALFNERNVALNEVDRWRDMYKSMKKGRDVAISRIGVEPSEFINEFYVTKENHKTIMDGMKSEFEEKIKIINEQHRVEVESLKRSRDVACVNTNNLASAVTISGGLVSWSKDTSSGATEYEVTLLSSDARAEFLLSENIALRKEIVALTKFKEAYYEWANKSDWLLKSEKVGVDFLGMHVADCIKKRFDELKEENGKLRDKLVQQL